MIKLISGYNFQSHRESILDLSSKVNVLIGSSDTGKTAIILRLLNWVINNRPGGDSFRSSWGGDTWGYIEIDNFLIGRCKTSKDNIYTITDPDGKEQVFKAMGQNVPEPIQQLLNFSELNLQKQFDQPFLLSLSPGEAGRYFNKIANLDKISLSETNIARTIRQEASDLKYSENELKNKNKEIQEYDWLDEADGRLTVLENAQKEIQSLTREESDLSDLIINITECQEQLDEIEPLWKAKEKVKQLLENENEIKELKERQLKLERTISSIENTEFELMKTKAELKLKRERFHKIMPLTCPLCGQEIKKGG